MTDKKINEGRDIPSSSIDLERIEILNKIKISSDSACIALWLLEEHYCKSVLRLSYFLSDSIKPSEINKVIPISSDVLTNHKDKHHLEVEFLTKNTLDFLKKISEPTGDIYSIALSGKKLTQMSIFPEEPWTYGRIGYVVIASKPDISLDFFKKQKTEIDQLCRELSSTIWSSRIERLMRINDSCMRHLTSRNTEQMAIKEVISALVNEVNCQYAAIYKRHDDHFILQEKIGSGLFYDKIDDKTFINKITERGVPARGNYLDNPGEILFNSSFDSWVISPILLDGNDISNSSFFLLSNFDSHVNDIGIVDGFIILCSKSRLDYIGISFSDADVRLSAQVSTHIAQFRSERSLEDVYRKTTDLFDNNFGSKIFPNSESLKFLKEYISSMNDMRLVHFSTDSSPDDLLDFIIDDHVKTAIFDKISRFVSTSRKKTEPKADTRVKICALKSPDKRDLYCIFHVPTEQDDSRFFVFHFFGVVHDKITHLILRHYVKEAHYYLKNADTIDERISVLTEIRHAVRGQLAYAKEYIENVKVSLEIAGRTKDDLWNLVNTKHFKEELNTAHYFCNQSMVMTETVRFLLSEISSSHLKITRIRPVQIIQNVRSALEREFRRRNIVFELKTSVSNTFTVRGDSLLIWIVIFNLLDNAVKFAHRDTRITVDLTVHQGRWTFRVRDEGVYLNPVDKSRVFRPFVRARVDEHLNRRPGTGLGLPVSRQIIRAHSAKADLEFTSERLPSNGERSSSTTAITVFWFDLPIEVPSGGE